jgi:hypothetical protein
LNSSFFLSDGLVSFWQTEYLEQDELLLSAAGRFDVTSRHLLHGYTSYLQYPLQLICITHDIKATLENRDCQEVSGTNVDSIEVT